MEVNEIGIYLTMLFVVAMLFFQLIATVVPSLKSAMGILSWSRNGLSYVTYPFIHASWKHLFGNLTFLVPLAFVMNFFHYSLPYDDIVPPFVLVWIVGSIIGGIFTVLLSLPGSLIVGCSGIINTLFGFELVYGVIHKDVVGTLVALVVLILYLPAIFKGWFQFFTGISWQAHISGFLIGAVIPLVSTLPNMLS